MGRKIAVCGKGGVGKTFVAGVLACRFASLGYQTLAIDADSSPNLALTLGLTSDQADGIVPVAENEDLIQKKTQTGYPGVFQLSYTVDDIIREYTTKTPCGVGLLVMGTVRAMGSGCACPAHSLIRNLNSHLVLERDEVVILDMEAGIEHLGRGTAEHVDILLIVTDAHQASLVTAGRIADIARNAGMKKVFLLGNRVPDPESEQLIQKTAGEHSCSMILAIPLDPLVMTAGIQGHSPVTLTESPAVRAVSRLAGLLEKPDCDVAT